ncbi:MAG: ABC transporter ATP-binding protein, partial [Cellulosilyticaceae bacterium]
MEEKELHSSKSKTIGRLSTYVRPYKWRTVGVITLLLIIMTCSTLTPYLMKYSLDNFVEQGDTTGLLGIGLLLLILTTLTMFLSKIRIYAMSKITNSILIDIRRELFTHLQTLSFKFFDSRPVGKILSRIVGDVNALQNLLNNSIVNLIPNIFTVVLVIIMMLLLSPTLTLICFLVMPFLFGAMCLIEIKAHKLWKLNRSNRSAFLGFTHEAFSGSRITQGFAREEYMKNRFNTHLDTHGNSFMTAIRIQDFLWPSVDLCRGVGICVILLSGFFLVQKELVVVTTLIAFIMYLEMLWRPVINLSAFYNAFITNLSAAERIFEVLDTQNDASEADADTMPEIKGEITFKHVTFSYDADDK